MNNFIKGFSEFKSILESNLSFYDSINEDAVESSIAKDMRSVRDQLFPGASLGIRSNYGKFDERYKKAYAYILDNKGKKKVADALSVVQEIIEIDANMFGKGLGYSDNKKFLALIVAVRASQMNIKMKEIFKDFGTLEYTLSSGNDINAVGSTGTSPNSHMYIKTRGKVNSGATNKVVNGEKQTTSNIKSVKKYINMANVFAAAVGLEGYSSEQMNDNGHFDLGKEWDTYDGSWTLVLYSTKKHELEKASKQIETSTKVIGAELPVDGKVDINFEAGKFDIPAGDMAKIAGLVKIIQSKIGDKKVDLFQLTSSASPEWGNKETMASYKGKLTSGSGKPAAGTDFAAKNAMLAYNRGISLMTELNKQLKAAGHQGFPSYNVNWQISDKGGPSNTGRFVDLNIEKNGAAGKTVTTNKSVSKVDKERSTTDGQATKMLYSIAIDYSVANYSGGI
jgi:hypothetical protein